MKRILSTLAAVTAVAAFSFAALPSSTDALACGGSKPKPSKPEAGKPKPNPDKPTA